MSCIGRFIHSCKISDLEPNSFAQWQMSTYNQMIIFEWQNSCWEKSFGVFLPRPFLQDQPLPWFELRALLLLVFIVTSTLFLPRVFCCLFFPAGPKLDIFPRRPLVVSCLFFFCQTLFKDYYTVGLNPQFCQGPFRGGKQGLLILGLIFYLCSITFHWNLRFPLCSKI